MTALYRTSLTSSGATALIATGRLTFAHVHALREQLHDLVKGGASRLVVDLSGVEAIDSSGVAALISGLKEARAVGGDLRIAAPSANTLAFLELLNLENFFAIFDSADGAFLPQHCVTPPLQRQTCGDTALQAPPSA